MLCAAAVAVRGLVLAIVVALLMPAGAWAHSAFLGSTPGPGQRLQTSPGRVVLRFTEALNTRLSRAELAPQRGGRDVLVRLHGGGMSITLTPVAELPRGAYVVRWHSVSTDDGHALEGSFSFGVRAPALGGQHTLVQSPLARGGLLRIGLRGLLYAALLVLVGGVLLGVLLPDRDGRTWLAPHALDEELADSAAAVVDRRVRALITAAGMIAAAAAIAVALADSADAAGGLSLAGARDYLLAGVAGLARVALIVLVLAAVALNRRSRRAAAGLCVLAVGAVAVSGHADSAEPRLPAVLNDWAHLLGASVWVGGIALIALTWGPARRSVTATARRAALRPVLAAFGPVALRAFAIVVVSGSVSALLELGHPRALWQTDYGRILALKIALVAVIALLSYLHAIRLRPLLLDGERALDEALERRHWRLLGSEPLVGLLVVAAVAVLVAFPLPPRQLGAEPAAAAIGAACDPCPLPAAKPDELAVAGRGGRNVVAAWIRRDRGRLHGTIRLIDIHGHPNPAPITIAGTRLAACGAGCHRFSARSSDTIVVRGHDQGRAFATTLPAVWRQGEQARARRLLNRAQERMRGLRSLRDVENVTSGPGSHAHTEYHLQAPDRLAYDAGPDVHRVEIGARRWNRIPPTNRWQRETGGDRSAFRTRSWFRWTPSAQSIQLLREDTRRHVATLALFDQGTPAWLQLTVDLRTLRVSRSMSATKAHFSSERFYANAPVTITEPRDVIASDAP